MTRLGSLDRAQTILDRLRRFEIRRPWADPEILRLRPYRILILTTTGIVGLLAILSAVTLFQIVLSTRYGIGVDFHQYLTHFERWQSTGQFYLPRQLAGPTAVMDGDPLYPPLILWLLAPFRVLPEVVWWVVPMTIIAITLVRLRPAPWTWPLLALIAVWPRTPALFLYGNPGMWTVAFVCLSLTRPWAGPLVLLKPSLAPFALIGIGRRSWAISLAVVALACLPFGSLWLDYVTALRNSHVPLTYSLLDLPVTIAPVLAFIGRRRSEHGSFTSGPSTPSTSLTESTRTTVRSAQGR